MSNMHRIVWLDAQIRGDRFPDSRRLAEKYEISVRQAQRDIEYLKYTMGAPLEYSAAKRGYYYGDKTFLLPAAVISDQDKQLLAYVANRYRMTGGTEAKRLADLFARLGSGTGEYEDNGTSIHLPVLQLKPEEAESYNFLSTALDRRCKVEMIYTDECARTTERIFHPYKLFNRDRNAYAAGYCELRSEIRTFRVSRMRRLVLLEDTYVIPEYFNENIYEQGKGFLYRSPYSALIVLDRTPEQGAFRLRFEQVEEKLFRFFFDSSDEILDALLLYKDRFSILSPNWLKEKLCLRLEKILRSHSDNDIICRTPSV